MKVDGLTVLAGNILGDIFVDQKLVSHAGQCSEFHTQFRLTSGGDFVVMDFHRDARFFERHHDLTADT